MSLNWDFSEVRDADRVCFQALPPGQPPEGTGWELDEEDGYYHRLHPKAYAIVIATPIIGMPQLTSSNLEEMLYRLDALFDAGVYFMFSDTPEGKVPIRINRHDLKQYLGLKTSARIISAAQFDKVVRGYRMDRQQNPMNPDH